MDDFNISIKNINDSFDKIGNIKSKTNNLIMDNFKLIEENEHLKNMIEELEEELRQEMQRVFCTF